MPRLFIAFAMALVLLASALAPPARAQSIVSDLEQEIRQRAAQIETKLIAWRRDIHEHPELGEQETRTAGVIAEHLTKLGLEVKTGVARTGAIAILKGSKPGPVVALRADMDALPVKEPRRLAVRVESQRQISRARSRCHARLRARRALRDPDGNGRGPHRHEGQAARDREVHVPACRGGSLSLSSVHWQDLGRQGDD